MSAVARGRAALWLSIFFGAGTAWALGAAPARALDDDDDAWTRPNIESPERFAWELRLGPYSPDVGNSAFSDTFGSDDGPLLATEFDVLIWRIPYVGPIGVGAGIGWANYSAHAFITGQGDRATEETSLTLMPVPVLAVLRADVLAREFHIPLVFTGKLGLDIVHWSTSTGKHSDASGTSLGLRWALQLELELDFFDRQAARVLDEEWGINHSFLFFEVFGSGAEGSSLPVGDTTWAAGLGLIL